MANQEHFDLLKQGAKIWNLWREQHPGIQGDVRRMRFIGDFRKFQDDMAYQRALQRLLRDLHV